MTDIFEDYPTFVPGRIGYGTLQKIIEWEQKHGIGHVTWEQVCAYREDGHSAAEVGLMLGLIDYGQASGCEDY